MRSFLKKTLTVLVIAVFSQTIVPSVQAAPPQGFEDLWDRIGLDAAASERYFTDASKGNFPLLDDAPKGLVGFAAEVVATAKKRNTQTINQLAPGEPTRTKLEVIQDWLALCVQMGDATPKWTQALALSKQVMAKQFDQNPSFDYQGAIANGNPSLALKDLFYYINGRGPVEQGYATGNPCLIAAANAFIADGAPNNGNLYPYFGGPHTSSYKNGECFAPTVTTCQPALKLTWQGTPDNGTASTILNSVNKPASLIQQYSAELAKIAAAQPTTPKPGSSNDPQSALKKGSVLALILPLGDLSLPQVISRVIRALLGIVGGLALAFFIWGGVKYMTAAGDTKKIADARGMIIAAIMGLGAIFLSYALLSLLIRILT